MEKKYGRQYKKRHTFEGNKIHNNNDELTNEINFLIILFEVNKPTTPTGSSNDDKDKVPLLINRCNSILCQLELMDCVVSDG